MCSSCKKCTVNAFWNSRMVGSCFRKLNSFQKRLNNFIINRIMIWTEICNLSRVTQIRETINLLCTKLSDWVISLNIDIKLARPCDLTPANIFLWGYLKRKVYANKPATMNNVNTNMRHTEEVNQSYFFAYVIENFDKQMTLCEMSGGCHISDILF